MILIRLNHKFFAVQKWVLDGPEVCKKDEIGPVAAHSMAG